ncbi:MAG: class I SAM-dependent methyltransferase [Bacteriovoracaceae bacterium]|nr:class I SAM-dependent methyltransferase [Bacteriovoracaceae bacterium]
MKKFSDEYLNILNTTLAGINLTNIKDSEEFFNKQILDSVLPLEHSAKFKDLVLKYGLVVDIGFGGGFPIIPLAYKCSDVKFIGIEARKKKVSAVEQISNHFKLQNVCLKHVRCEEMIFDKTSVITLKAVGKIEDFLKKIRCTCKQFVFFYKGPNYKELESINNLKKNWKLIEEKEINIPGAEGRFLIGFEIEKNVPRGTFSKKDLVKLSEFL